MMAQGTGARAIACSTASPSSTPRLGAGSALPIPAFIVALLVALLAGCVSGGGPANLEERQSSVSETPLIAAAKSGDLDRVQALAASGASLNTLTEVGTPLSAAVAAGQDRVAWYLLSEGVAPDRATADGVTPLMIAAGDGSRRLVQLLLSAGAWVNAASRDGATPVMLAARNGHLSVVKILLAAGANVNVSQGGRSLLMHVVASGDLLTAEMLVAAGADVNFRASDGTSALDLARVNHNRELEMLLVQAGATQ